MSAQEWSPGEPLHPVVDGVTRPMFEVLDDDLRGDLASKRARWPDPQSFDELPEGDEIGRLIWLAKGDL
jgi:hypothetical protein